MMFRGFLAFAKICRLLLQQEVWILRRGNRTGWIQLLDAAYIRALIDRRSRRENEVRYLVPRSNFSTVRSSEEIYFHVELKVNDGFCNRLESCKVHNPGDLMSCDCLFNDCDVSDIRLDKYSRVTCVGGVEVVKAEFETME